MAEKSVIIIGAGLAGLSAGCYLRMNGYRTHIIEHHKAGGVAAAWKRKDYLIEGGIHYLMCHKPGSSIYEVYRELGTAQANKFPDMTNYCRFIDEASGRSVSFVQDLDGVEADLKSLFPGDKKIIEDLITGARVMQASDTGSMGFEKPPELMSPLDGLKQMWAMRRILKYFGGKYAKPASEYARDVRDPFLKRIIENLFTPEAPVWFVMMLLGLLAKGQMGLLEGGSKGFVLPIVERYKALGGEVTYKIAVEKIIVEDNRAVGVKLSDGSVHRADIVVSAADGYSTIYNLLDGRYLDEKIKNRYNSWKLCRPLMMVNFGVAREFPGEPPLNIINLKNTITVGSQNINGIFPRIFNYSSKFAPAGKTLIQVEFETEWDYWNDLQKNDRASYDAEKERIASEILARMEAHYPGISAQMEMTDVATPYTLWRYTMNHKGSYGGWLISTEAIMTLIKRTLPGLKNFYMAGQWVMGSGSVPGSLYSGRHVAQILCHQDQKRFTTSVP